MKEAKVSLFRKKSHVSIVVSVMPSMSDMWLFKEEIHNHEPLKQQKWYISIIKINDLSDFINQIILFYLFFFFLFNNILARKQCSKCCPRLCNQTTSTSEINDKEYDNRIGWTNSIKGQRTLFACRKVWHFLCTRQRIKFYIVVQVSQYLLKDV